MAINAVAAVLIAVSGLVGYGAWNEWSKYQTIRNTPRSTVRSIAIGLTELHSTLKAKNPLESPLTRKNCVAHQYEIEEHHHDDDGSDWHTIKQSSDQAKASLKDDTDIPIERLRDRLRPGGTLLLPQQDGLLHYTDRQDNPAKHSYAIFVLLKTRWDHTD